MLTKLPKRKVKLWLGVRFHKNPATKLDDRAITPIKVWNVPNAVALNSSVDKSQTKAL